MEQAAISLSQELDAMAALGQVLGNLTDSATRQRALHCAAERFALEMPAGGQSPAAVPERSTRPERADIDPALAVDSLDDMFSPGFEDLDGDLDVFAGAEPRAETPKAPIEVVLRSFAADFQRFAEEWNGASA